MERKKLIEAPTSTFTKFVAGAPSARPRVKLNEPEEANGKFHPELLTYNGGTNDWVGGNRLVIVAKATKNTLFMLDASTFKVYKCHRSVIRSRSSPPPENTNLRRVLTSIRAIKKRYRKYGFAIPKLWRTAVEAIKEELANE